MNHTRKQDTPPQSACLYDVIVIGSGIVGSMVARELSRFKLAIAVIEKEPQAGFGVTKASLSYIHRNHINPPSSLRAKLCQGSQAAFSKLAEELGLAYREADEINIAFDSEQETQVRQRLDWAYKNGETGFRIIEKEDVARLEPHLTRDFVFATQSLGNGMIHPPEWAFALIENATLNGADFFPGTEVTGLQKSDAGHWKVSTTRGSLAGRFILNAAGLHAEKIARLAGDTGVTLFPTRGTFAIFDSSVSYMLRHLIYVAGQDLSFSQAMGPTVHGNIILGLGRFREPEELTDSRVTKNELDCIIKMGRQIIPELPERQIITYFAGIKTTNNLATRGDFFIGPSSVSPTLIHALICSPGITASPGIARLMLDILSNAGLDLVEKQDFVPCNERSFHFHSADETERSQAIESDCRCGHLVCRCEQVSEAEVRTAVSRGVTTIDGVKHLTRAGMGRCQGGFCGPAVVKILAQELGIEAEDLSRKGKGSEELSR